MNLCSSSVVLFRFAVLLIIVADLAKICLKIISIRYEYLKPYNCVQTIIIITGSLAYRVECSLMVRETWVQSQYQWL